MSPLYSLYLYMRFEAYGEAQTTISMKKICDLIATLIAYQIPSKPDKVKVGRFNESFAEFPKLLKDTDENEWELLVSLRGKSVQFLRFIADYLGILTNTWRV